LLWRLNPYQTGRLVVEHPISERLREHAPHLGRNHLRIARSGSLPGRQIHAIHAVRVISLNVGMFLVELSHDLAVAVVVIMVARNSGRLARQIDETATCEHRAPGTCFRTSRNPSKPWPRRVAL